jgi:hypothetical protein
LSRLPIPSDITKTYASRGPLQQYRLAESIAFTCFRCGQNKKSKLVTVYGADWSRELCNGCYGQLLSLYEIKAGTAPDDQRADELASALLAFVGLDEQRRAEERILASENRAQRLSGEALRFIATAEHVAEKLEPQPYLEWSPAVIGLCKAVEVEVVSRLLRPLAVQASVADLRMDRKDKDLKGIATFCVDPSRTPPNLGTFAHFLQTAINSEERRWTSPLIGSFLKLTTRWTGSNWLLDPHGFHPMLSSLTERFRNRAAHIDELAKADYDACRAIVIGSEGILWRLLVATES